MTTEETTTRSNYWTHGTAANRQPHQWRYLGRKLQTYHCIVCDMRVTKATLKEATDA